MESVIKQFVVHEWAMNECKGHQGAKEINGLFPRSCSI